MAGVARYPGFSAAGRLAQALRRPGHMGPGGSGIQLSFAGLQEQHKPRRPEETVLYRTVAAHFRIFEAIAETEGKRIPKHVGAEFEAFLKCGILAHGFLRLKCGDCKSEKLVAFSCKKRGFCSSCGGRRMVESTAHLIDEVFSKVGVTQWVLSFPMPIRFILAKNSQKRVVPTLPSSLHQIRALMQPPDLRHVQR